MKKLLKVIGVRDEYMEGGGERFCTRGKEYKVYDVDKYEFSIKDDSGNSHIFDIDDCDWFKLIYEGEQLKNNNKEEVMNKLFKVEDKVKLISDLAYTTGKAGDTVTIIKVEEDDYYIRIDKDNYECFAVDSDLKLVNHKNVQQLEIITEGTTTRVRIGNKEGVAKLFHEDTYSKEFGFVVAAGRALGIDLVAEVQKVVKSYDKPTVEEIKEFAGRTKLTGSGLSSVKGIVSKTVSGRALNKFQVGDIVNGVKNNFYSITDEKMTKGEIVKIDKYGNLSIKVIEHKDLPLEIGETYNDLESKYFRLIETPSIKNPILKELKVGDLVKVKSDLVVNKKYDELDTFIDDMVKYLGRISTIESIDNKGEMKLKGFEYLFTPSMLDRVGECAKVTIFKKGDKVRLISDDPTDGFGGVNVGDIGTITNVYNDRDLLINFHENNIWSGIPSEVELVSSPKYKVGQEVNKDEAVSILKAGGKVNHYDWIYFEEDNVLKYKKQNREIRKSSGYDCNLSGTSIVVSL
ncbi:hypothetical protein [Clostridium sp.]|uniref:hypothetical protein n=1 Tax=Clostridium sp. TaxID=1506 RepID=UPI001A55855E|nr:hypothetical protein [Clostridium sp.]MBK5242143.1 hypothetical protein [Clostridium sp.]